MPRLDVPLGLAANPVQKLARQWGEFLVKKDRTGTRVADLHYLSISLI